MHRKIKNPLATRKHERAELDTYANKILGDQPYLARVRDISTGGVFLYKLLEPQGPSEEPVGIELKLPNSDDIIWAIGEVVREERRNGIDGVALRFTRIADCDREIIDDYVTSCRADDLEEQPKIAVGF